MRGVLSFPASRSAFSFLHLPTFGGEGDRAHSSWAWWWGFLLYASPNLKNLGTGTAAPLGAVVEEYLASFPLSPPEGRGLG